MRSSSSVVLFLLLACVHQEPTGEQVLIRGEPAVDQEFRLAIGETAVFTGSDLRVTAQAVANDSRCPHDVQCFAAGSAAIEFRVHRTAQDTVFTMNRGGGGVSFSETAISPGFTIEFTAITPYPENGGVPIPIADYRVGLLISALPPLAGSPLPLTRIEGSGYGGFDTTATLVVRDSAAWSALWRQMWSPWSPVVDVPPLPAVDFATEMIVAFASGARPSFGYDALLTGAAVDGRVVRVQVLERSPGMECVTGEAITSPIDVARMPKRPEPVIFSVSPGVSHCGA